MPDGVSSGEPKAPKRVGDPGELSLLLQEVARAPEGELAGSWEPGHTDARLPR